MSMRSWHLGGLFLFFLMLGISMPALPDNALPPQLKGVTIQQRLNQQVPLDLYFHDETGKQVQLKQYFHEKPVILSLAYYTCPMLCPYVLRDLAGSLKGVSFDIGKEFEVITISFDPRDTPASAARSKAEYMKIYARSGAEKGWHFLTGDQKSIESLTKAVGFSYHWDDQQKQFIHASGLMILTPQGRLARYFYGIEYPPKDVRLALVEASANKIGSPVDQVLLFCFHYDPSTGKYSAYAINLVRLGGIITVFALGIFIYKNTRQRG